MADFVAVPFGTVNHEHGERRKIQNITNNLKSSSGIERIPFNGIDELDTEQGTSFANAFFQATFGSTAERTVIVNLTNGNGASGAVTLTFTPTGSGSSDYITAFNIAWNASTNARLSEYSATVGAFIDNSSITANMGNANSNISTLTIVDDSTTFTVTTSDFSLGIVVYALNTGDSRIRFVGSGWQQVSALGGKITTVIRTLTINDYVEITFFGTALNLLVFQDNTTGYDWRATVDGGAESGNLRPSNPSAVLQNNGQINIILPTASNLSPGVHTVRIRNASNGGGTDGFTIYGCEIINENAGISQQPGADFDGRVEALSGTTFPIKPLNTTISAVNSRNGASEAFAGTTGARVLNYITSGGQFKQSFDVADEAPVVTVAGEQSYSIEIQTGGSTSVTLPISATSFIVTTYGSGGGGGGAGRFNIGLLRGGSGGGGGGAGKAGATFTRTTSTQAETLALVVPGTSAGGVGLSGSGFPGPNSSNGVATTIITGGTTISSAPGGGGGGSGIVQNGGGGGAGGTVGAAGTSQAFTGWTIASQTDTAGSVGLPGQADDNAAGGAGGNVGGFASSPLTGTEGQGGAAIPAFPGGTGSDGNPGDTPGGGGGGASTEDTGSDHTGGTGAAGRVYLVITAAAGLAFGDFGVATGEFTAGSLSGGMLGATTAVFGNQAFDTNRLNQEVIRRINVREFGANNAFATASNAVSAFFTLDDGTTTLTAERSGTTNAGDLGFNTAFGKSYISFNRTGSTDGRKSVTITFVGTGLDTEWIYSGTGSAVYGDIDVTIDGLSIGNLTPIAANAATNTIVVRPIVSGLAYGTHTVSFSSPNNSSGFDNAFGIADFILYGPKKPEIPTLDAGALELSDYNIMADYVARTATGTLFLSKGTIAKTPDREITYTGSGSRTPSDGFSDDPFGVVVGVTGANDTVSYTFYGTGINVQARTNNVTFVNTVQVDGAALAARFTTTTLTEGTGSGAGAYVAGTSTWTGGAGAHNDVILITGMPLGVHTIEFTRTAGQFLIEGMWIETPIHINDDNLKVGSEGLNNLTIDPVVEEDEAVVLANLGEAKAWLSFNTTNLGTGNAGPNSTILSSYNIAAVLQSPAGSTSVIQVYFDKPFKGNTYVVSGLPEHTNGSAGSIAVDRRTPATNVIAKTGGSVQLISSINNTVFDAVFHGELIDE